MGIEFSESYWTLFPSYIGIANLPPSERNGEKRRRWESMRSHPAYQEAFKSKAKCEKVAAWIQRDIGVKIDVCETFDTSF